MSDRGHSRSKADFAGNASKWTNRAQISPTVVHAYNNFGKPLRLAVIGRRIGGVLRLRSDGPRAFATRAHTEEFQIRHKDSEMCNLRSGRGVGLDVGFDVIVAFRADPTSEPQLASCSIIHRRRPPRLPSAEGEHDPGASAGQLLQPGTADGQASRPDNRQSSDRKAWTYEIIHCAGVTGPRDGRKRRSGVGESKRMVDSGREAPSRLIPAGAGCLAR